MNVMVRQMLQRPCLIERTEGVVIIEPLQFIPRRNLRPLNRKQAESAK